MSDPLTHALTLAGQGRVQHRWITRNSGPDFHQWIVGSRAATLTEADALSMAYRRGLIGESGSGWIRIGVRGRAHLELNGGNGGPPAAEDQPDGADRREVHDPMDRHPPAGDREGCAECVERAGVRSG